MAERTHVLGMMKQKRPLILITPSYTSDRRIRMSTAYLNALYDCGAIGVYVAYTEDPNKIREYADIFDGFLFAGGVDIEPVHYGEEVEYDTVEIDADRDRFELLLFREVLKTGKPIFGICRGEQLINVAMGGTLHQHLEGHRQEEPGIVPTQQVNVIENSRLSAVLSVRELSTNTFHHQAVKDVAPLLRAVAWSEDGIVEAVESENHPFLLGVQWHPELAYQNSDAARALFSAFVEATTQF